MSSSLAMVLMSAMAVPANGPEMVSGEVGPAPLILDGTWMGTITYEDKQIRDVILSDHHIFELSWSRVAVSSWEMKDEGYGKFRVAVSDDDYLGIYEWRDDCVALCIRRSAKVRPTSFRAGDGQELLILHRVKPGE